MTSEPDTAVRLVVADGIGVLRLARPPVNALDAAAQEDLRRAAEEAASRDDVAAVVLYGGERQFSAGADIREMAAMSHSAMLVHAERLSGAFTAVADIPKPVVAAITGFALGGGCELALTADYRVCADDTRIGLPEIALGVIPGAGGTQRLSRLVGTGRAKRIIFTGAPLGAAQALDIGLVDEVVPADQVLAASTAWASQFVGGPALALRAAKQAVDLGAGTDLRSGLQIERALFAGLFGTEDRSIGMTSFVTAGPGRAGFVGR
ncbi:enoyl-CoA hydratase/isomerase family protein [Actinokineospora sp.]|uniref:enoyl-CoA hydratase/isomerase family protein n=1 Tax=Actinokineospora sp. TaxID=1872133 RepID=UPI003D6BF7BC